MLGYSKQRRLRSSPAGNSLDAFSLCNESGRQLFCRKENAQWKEQGRKRSGLQHTESPTTEKYTDRKECYE